MIITFNFLVAKPGSVFLFFLFLMQNQHEYKEYSVVLN